MAIVTLPPAVRIRRVEWTLDQPAQVNRSPWTKARQVVDQPGPSLWTATAELVTAIGEAAALEAEAFLVDLEGQRNRFRLRLSETAQAPESCAPVADGAQATARTLNLRGGTPGALLRRGHKVTVNDQPVMLMAAATFGPDGRATIGFKPSLRYAVADGATVEVRRPTALVALADSSIGWAVDPGQLYQFKTIALEEAF